MTRESRLIAVASARVHFTLEGAGETLVLLHGFTGSAEAMAPLASALALDHRVVSIDLPGHGLSDAPQNPARYAMKACVADVIGVLDALQTERAHLVGYSMGGRVALALAVAHPDRIASAVLIGASAGLAHPGARAERRRADEALARSIESDGVAPFVERWMAQPLFATQARLPAAIREATRAQRLANVAQGLAGSLRGLGTGAQPPLHDTLRHCSVPLLFLAGEHDAKFRAIAVELAALAKHAAHEIVADAGHAAQLENPRDVVALARRFIGAHSPKRKEGTP